MRRAVRGSGQGDRYDDIRVRTAVIALVQQPMTAARVSLVHLAAGERFVVLICLVLVVTVSQQGMRQRMRLTQRTEDRFHGHTEHQQPQDTNVQDAKKAGTGDRHSVEGNRKYPYGTTRRDVICLSLRLITRQCFQHLSGAAYLANLDRSPAAVTSPDGFRAITSMNSSTAA